jgi:rRNA maturation RNase YbeY
VPVELSCDLKRASRYTTLLREEAAILMRLVGEENCELSILLTGDRRMKRLNSYYRYRDRPTDVLSFAQGEIAEAAITLGPDEYRPPDANLIGDVAISLETATRQAREMRQSVSQRLRTLLVHGVLHLLGYDHERSKADARLMFDYQNKLEAALEEAVKTTPTAGEQAR